MKKLTARERKIAKEAFNIGVESESVYRRTPITALELFERCAEASRQTKRRAK